MSADRAAAAGLALAIITAIVGVALWAAQGLAAKASREDVQTLQVWRAGTDVHLRWLAGTVYEIAKHQGIVVPPPPGP